MPEDKKTKKKKKSGKSNWTSFNAKRSAEREAERERKKNMESQPLQDDTTEAHEEAEKEGKFRRGDGSTRDSESAGATYRASSTQDGAACSMHRGFLSNQRLRCL